MHLITYFSIDFLYVFLNIILSYIKEENMYDEGGIWKN